MVQHPNIVELHDVMASKFKIYFAMELVCGSKLFWRRSGESLFPKTHFCHWFYHSRGAYHRDLKPENLLLDKEGNSKVIDFSLNSFTEHLKQDGLLHTTCGTLGYMAPEVIGKKGYDGAKALWVVQV
ncbi:CBL-interacting serine/threonine-protein kinase 6 [Quercus suber]|uniref:Cbl-interacting serine/threonine-protein kinase 6 n=1 Tax=Quercus suber TaxID=58331 RepID=A0AAW0M0U4_QUESU|nr:CBL-interacting serine/threonine-protein kinase 6-like [Quercus suber]POF15950.1 cbl-interacting serine/threonine-protein kinase 6 [Quercus suber]